MARALPSSMTLTIEGDETAPNLCYCDYEVSDGDLQEPRTNYEEGSPDWNQQVNALGTATVTAIKSAEGIA